MLHLYSELHRRSQDFRHRECSHKSGISLRFGILDEFGLGGC